MRPAPVVNGLKLGERGWMSGMTCLAAAMTVSLAAASPALACWAPSPRATAESAAPGVAFTAVVIRNERTRLDLKTEQVTLALSTERDLVGAAPETTVIRGLLGDEISGSFCGPPRPEPWQFAQIELGTEVVVSGVEMPGEGLVVRFVEPISSERGRSLLADLELSPSP